MTPSSQSSPVPEVGTAAWWNQHYAQGQTPWDSGIVPPELRDLVNSGLLRPPGITLDLGCGTGTNVNFLSQRGFTVFGIDLAGLALAEARRKALAAGLPARFCAADVANLDFLAVQADFALDMGCLHSLSAQDRDRYVASLARRIRPGGLYLLYGFDHDPDSEHGPIGFQPQEVRTRFAPHFRLIWRRPSRQGERPVAWYLLERVAAG